MTEIGEKLIYPMKEVSVSEAIKILNKGGIIIFPTDTAFGVGCRIDKPEAVKRIFTIRRRPQTQATPVLVSSITMAQNYLVPLSDIVRRLMQTYWPGALTIVYQCNTNKTPLLVRGGGKSLGVRMPNHPIILKMIEKIGVPVLGPSANFHKSPTPYRFEDLDKEFLSLVDGVITGHCFLNDVSTVIDCTKKPFKIIRQGVFKIKDNMVLFIDSSERNTTVVSLNINGKEKKLVEVSETKKAQNTLPLIEKLLKDEGIKLTDLTEIKINTGPGSFVGLRVGVSIANTLGFLLKIPVNGKITPILPHYK